MAFMQRLADAIGARDPLFECRVVPVGSSYEGTKVGRPDEFDVNFVLTRFSSLYEVVTSPACPPGFVHLKRHTMNANNSRGSEVYAREFRSEIDPMYSTSDGQFLNTTAVRQDFERLLNRVLRGAEFWTSENIFELKLASDRDLYDVQSRGVCTSVKLTVNPPINGVVIFDEISVDIVPCLHITDYWPTEAVQEVSEDLKSDGCHLVFDEPHRLYPWISSSSIPYARISFARAESRIIHNAPPLAKAAFMIGKHLASFRKDNTASHTLKVSLLHCLASAARCNTRRASSWSRDYNDLSQQELYTMVGRLLFSLLQLCRQDFMQTYFLPQHFLLPFCEIHWLRESSIRLWIAGVLRLSERIVESGRLVKFMQKDKENDPSLYIDCDSFSIIISAFYALFDSEPELKIFDYGSFTNPLFEKFNRTRLINSFY